MDEVSQRLLQVYEAVVKHRLTPAEAAKRYGMSLQVFHNYVRKLADGGWIRRKEHLPENARWDQEYPWEPTGQPITYQPLPPDAKLRVGVPVSSQQDMTVATIRFVRWGDWVVQAAPILRLDGASGRAGNDKIPNLRVVVISNVAMLDDPPHPEDGVCFLASTRQRWFESDTLLQLGRVEDPVVMTQAIAAALGVEAVINMSKQPPTEGE